MIAPSPISGYTATLRPNSAKPNFVCPQDVIRHVVHSFTNNSEMK